MVQDIGLNFAYGLPKLKTAYLLEATPYVSIHGGFGHTDSEKGEPTNVSVGAGFGLKKEIYKNIDLDLGLLYQKRFWVEITRPLGGETWEDSEMSAYIGLHCLF